MIKKYSNKLYCFSPPVMVATFLFELGSALYVLFRYKLNAVTRLVGIILLSLAVFQLAEYFVCGGLGVDARTWSRIGYAVVTLLPPLGLHLIHEIASKKSITLLPISYATAVAFVIQFLISEQVFTSYLCTGNYVIFRIGGNLGKLFFVYYYVFLLIGIILAMRWSRALAKKNSKDKKRAYALNSVSVGYVLFMFPTAFLNIIRPDTRRAIPSIMCGFAVLFAIALVGYVAPKMSSKK